MGGFFRTRFLLTAVFAHDIVDVRKHLRYSINKGNQMTPTKQHARRVLEVVDAGLCVGLGEPTPGKMCVEAAVCFALGEPHGDEPSCVGEAVRQFKIVLNDAAWSSDEARAKGMRRVAVAQLGSDQVSQQEFAKEVALQTVRQILPIALRAAASVIPSHNAALEVAAVACEIAADLRAASDAASYAARAARAASRASYASDASDAASDAARAASYAASYASDAASYASDAASYAARAASYAASAASYAVLVKAAEIGVQALKKVGSLGCEWLDICI